MAICLDFELIEVIGTKARYRFGNCLKPLDGMMEVDLEEFIRKGLPSDTTVDKVMKLLNNQHSEQMAMRVFMKIYKHYLKTNEYPTRGGYYA